MQYNAFGDREFEVSAVGLGGHEYFDGGVRGFNDEERERAVTPGVHLDGFGGERRRALVRTAVDHGVTYFDVTIDEEKAALGRNLEAIAPEQPVVVQTRPAGMVYTYGDHNTGFTDYDRLRAEVERVTDLLRRDRVDVLNVGFERGALDHHDDFLGDVGRNLARLEDEGLIRAACVDAPDPDAFHRAIDSGHFDALSLDYHFASSPETGDVVEAAARAGMAVVTRAVFMKGDLFRMADQAGLEDLDAVARTSIRWCLSQSAVTSVLVGADTAAEFERNLQAVADPSLTAADESRLAALRDTAAYAEREA